MIDDVKPRFRRDALFAESEDGVYLRRPGAEFVLKGRSVYRWMTTLVPRMNGEHTVRQLAEGLADGHRKTLLGLIKVLTERGYVYDDQGDVAARSSAETRERFSRQIEYVAHFASTGEASFDTFRESRFLVVGTTDLVAAVRRGLVDNGAENVDVGEYDTPTAYDLVVAAGGDVRDMVRLNESAYGGGPRLLPLVVIGDQAIAGPLVGARSGPCWQCALLRQSNVRPAEESARLWRSAALGGSCDADRCPPQLARMVGTMLAFEAFRLRTGALPPETENSLVVQDLTTGESERARLLPHPLCSVCSRENSTETTVPERPADYDTVVGRHGAILSGYRDSELTQSPVRVGRVTLPSAEGPDRTIAAFDVDTVDNARRAAVREALTCYAEQIAGMPASLSGRPDGDGFPLVPVRALSIHSGLSAPEPGTWVQGRSLLDGRSHWLPAGAAYPQSRHNSGMVFESTSAGTACADSLETAERAGLLTALGYAGLCAALRGERPAEEIVDLSDATEPVGFLIRSAGHLGTRLRVLDLPGCSPGFGCVVTADEEEIWALGTGYSQADAVAAALQDVLGTVGLRMREENPDLGNPVLPGLDVRRLRTTEPTSPRNPVTHPEIVDQLRERRRDAFVVDTTPSDLRGAGFVTVRVLLSDSSA